MGLVLQKHFEKWPRHMVIGLLSGILFSTSYPPFPAWALFFAFSPLWWFWFKTESFREVFWAGFTTQFVMTLVGFNWIAHTAIEYGHLPAIVSIFILLGFCLFANLSVPLAGLTAKFVQRRLRLNPIFFFLLVACLSSFFEWIYPSIFPWNPAYPLLYSRFHSAQLAQFLGFNLLGTLVYFANGAFAFSLSYFPRKGWSRPLVIFVLCLFVCEWLGDYTEKQLPLPDKKIHALLVQPNIGNYDKFVAERGNGFQGPIVEKDLELTRRGLSQAKEKNLQVDVVILPETAYPASLDPFFKNAFYVKMLTDFVDQTKVPLITGAYSDDPSFKNDRKSYNGVFAIQPNSPLQNGYRKNLLLAFGEYFPGAEYFPFLKTLIPEISDFGRGIGPILFKVGETLYSPLICYEGLDTTYVRRVADQGGHIIVNVTNDSWFGTFFEPRQHMVMTIARAIEYRRPIVRVTNTGITTVADAHGKLLLQSPQNEPWTTLAEVPYSSQIQTTFFSVIEPYLTLIFLALSVLVIFFGRIFR